MLNIGVNGRMTITVVSEEYHGVSIINNKISNECPMGTALLGHIVGETVSVDAPDGAYQLKILGIRR